MTNYDIQQSREWWAQRWLDLLESLAGGVAWNGREYMHEKAKF
jgi:uncharacterized Zn finger protein